jgi:hypothetical protein
VRGDRSAGPAIGSPATLGASTISTRATILFHGLVNLTAIRFPAIRSGSAFSLAAVGVFFQRSLIDVSPRITKRDHNPPACDAAVIGWA